MGEFGMFESLTASESGSRDQRLAKEAAADEAIYVVRERFGAFLAQAESKQDFEDRFALVENDVRKAVAEVTRPVPGIMRRVKGALKPGGKGQPTPRQTRQAAAKLSWAFDKARNAWVAEGANLKFATPCCGQELDLGFGHCKCGKTWNSWQVASTDKQAAGSKYFAREVAERPTILALRKKADDAMRPVQEEELVCSNCGVSAGMWPTSEMDPEDIEAETCEVCGGSLKKAGKKTAMEGAGNDFAAWWLQRNPGGSLDQIGYDEIEANIDEFCDSTGTSPEDVVDDLIAEGYLPGAADGYLSNDKTADVDPVCFNCGEPKSEHTGDDLYCPTADGSQINKFVEGKVAGTRPKARKAAFDVDSLPPVDESMNLCWNCGYREHGLPRGACPECGSYDRWIDTEYGRQQLREGPTPPVIASKEPVLLLEPGQQVPAGTKAGTRIVQKKAADIIEAPQTMDTNNDGVVEDQIAEDQTIQIAEDAIVELYLREVEEELKGEEQNADTQAPLEQAFDAIQEVKEEEAVEPPAEIDEEPVVAGMKLSDDEKLFVAGWKMAANGEAIPNTKKRLVLEGYVAFLDKQADSYSDRTTETDDNYEPKIPGIPNAMDDIVPAPGDNVDACKEVREDLAEEIDEANDDSRDEEPMHDDAGLPDPVKAP